MSGPDATVRAFVIALNASDPDAAAATFDPNGSLMADEVATLTGAQAVREYFAGVFASVRFARDVHIDRMVEDGKLATIEAHTTGTTTLVTTGDAVPAYVSRQLFVLRRAAGEWRIVEYMYNRAGT
jgi:ketosteroid isomerase-like protein